MIYSLTYTLSHHTLQFKTISCTIHPPIQSESIILCLYMFISKLAVVYLAELLSIIKLTVSSQFLALK